METRAMTLSDQNRALVERVATAIEETERDG